MYFICLAAQWKWMIGRKNLIYRVASPLRYRFLKMTYLGGFFSHIWGGCDSTAIKSVRGHRLPHSLRAFCSLKSPRRVSFSTRPSSPHRHVYVSNERRPTFILMMSVTQLTCASLFSQQKCLRRGERAWSESVDWVFASLIWLHLRRPGDWVWGEVTAVDVLMRSRSLITVNRLSGKWAGCCYIWLDEQALVQKCDKSRR